MIYRLLKKLPNIICEVFVGRKSTWLLNLLQKIKLVIFGGKINGSGAIDP
jgi:hypothetical protein